MKKFELTNETTEYLGKKLYRIKALRSFGSIEEGELGGFVAKESNLDQEGDAWVSGDAQVFEDARVYGEARVSGEARVFGEAWVFGDAQVSGDAQVFGNAEIFGDAQVFGDAWVSGNAQVSGDAHVSGNAQVFGNSQVFGCDRSKGKSKVIRMADSSGDSFHDTPLSLLQEAIKDITEDRSNLARCNKLLILGLNTEDDMFDVSFMQARMRMSECVTLCTAANTIFLREMGYAQ